jgi:hypothetical protein
MPEPPLPERFQALEELARTECEVLLRARDRLLQREVVISRPGLSTSAPADPRELERSLRQARALARVAHPGVVRLLDVIETAAGPLLVMEPVAGETLAERLAREGRLEPESVRKLGVSLCEALEAVHAVGVVHRGISAANIVLRTDGTPCLSGFTFAKFGAGELAMPGTTFIYDRRREKGAPAEARTLPPHPAPEQIGGQTADARSDLFGLGWVLYECLTGEEPYPRDRDPEHWDAPVDPRQLAPAALPALADAILKCLRTSPLKRFASAKDLREALEVGASATAAIAVGAGAARGRRKRVTAVAGAALLLVGGGAYLALGPGSRGVGAVLGAGSRESTRGVDPTRRGPLDPGNPFSGKVYENLWAVVIGINQYEKWPALSYAVPDALAVKELLISSFGFHADHVLELIDRDATVANIRHVLGDELHQRTQSQDGVMVFFAGHGQTAKLPGGGDMGYLVPVDGSAEENEYYSTLLPMSSVREISSLIPAKHVFFAIDACYSGLAATSERRMVEETKLMLWQHAQLRSRQILTAGGKGEPVIEKPEWGHSAFTYKLLEGLGKGMADSDQDGVITSTEIANYIKASVPGFSDHRQMPQFKSLSNDSEADFIFIRPEAAAVEASKSGTAETKK